MGTSRALPARHLEIGAPGVAPIPSGASDLLSAAMLVPGIRAISVDFFDTLVWRKTTKPIDAFLQLGRKLLADGRLASPRNAVAFAQLRVAAESEARERRRSATGSYEISLSDIYKAFPTGAFSVPLAEIEAAERRVESELLVPDRALARALAVARQAGKRIVICSDTYFAAEDLQQFLVDSGIDQTLFERIFVSSAHGIAKSQGLLAKVAYALSLPESTILHVGDHPQNDLGGAKLLGMPALLYPTASPFAEAIARRYRRLDGLGSRTKPFVEPEGGITGLSRRYFVFADDGAATTETEIVAHVLGPILCGYAEWLGEEVRRTDPDAVLCPTREGIFLSAFLNRYFERVGIKTRAEYFPTSRAALLRASFAAADRSELERYFYAHRLPITVERLCQRFGIDSFDIPLKASYLNYPIRRGCAMSDRIIAELAASATVRDALMESASRSAARFRACLERTLAKGVSARPGPCRQIMIADVGWTGGSQRIIESLVKQAQPDTSIRGRYLMLDEGAIGNALAGTDLEGWLFALGEAADFGRVILPVKELLEQTLTSDVASVDDYDEAGEPILAPHLATPLRQRFQRQRLQSRLMSFLDFYLGQRAGAHDADGGSMRGVSLLGSEAFLRTHLAAQIAEPTAPELAMFGSWVHEDNNTAQLQERLLDDHQQALFRYASLGEIFRTPSYWHMAALRRARPELVEHAFIQQLLGEYGSGESCTDQPFSIEILGPEVAEPVIRHSSVRLTPAGRGIGIVQLYTNAGVTLRCKNRSERTLEIEDVLVEWYDTERFAVGTARSSDGQWAIALRGGEAIATSGLRWLGQSTIEIDLGKLPMRSSDLSVALCCRIS